MVETFRPVGFRGPRLGGPEGRPGASARGYGSRWSRYASAFRVSNPKCVRCWFLFGLVTATRVVDHIACVDGPTDPLFWPVSNHQALCVGCHAVKTTAEKRGERFTPDAPYPPASAG